MNSKVMHGHPIHPALIAVPLDAFVLALLGDIATAVTHDRFWYQWSFYCISIGIICALVAAIPGFVEYVALKMRDLGSELATTQMVLNLASVALYLVEFELRQGRSTFPPNRMAPAIALEVVALAIIGLSDWIGNQMPDFGTGHTA